MKISVITPTYNRRDCILNSVKSVQNQKNTNISWEMIIHDDGSTDNTKALFHDIKDSRIHYEYDNINRGVNAARNRAIKRSNGDYLLLLDSDDQLTKNAFQVIDKHYKNNELEAINFFGTKDIKTGKKMSCIHKTRKYTYKEYLSQEYVTGEFIALVRKDVFEKYTFDEDRFCFEMFFWTEAIKEYGVFAVDTVIRLYDHEPENRVSNKLHLPKNSNKRFCDFDNYIKMFRNDYIRLGLKPQLAQFEFRAGLYAALSKNISESKKYLTSSIKKSFRLHTLLFLALVYTCPSAIILGYSTLLKIQSKGF